MFAGNTSPVSHEQLTGLFLFHRAVKCLRPAASRPVHHRTSRVVNRAL